jgi:hypothetical protein
MASTATSQRFFAARPRSAVFVDVALAGAVLVASVALLLHSGDVPSRPGGTELDLLGTLE